MNNSRRGFRGVRTSGLFCSTKHLEKTEVGATGASEQLPERCGRPRNGPRSVAGALGTAARALQEPSGRRQERSGSPPNGFKSTQRAFGAASRAFRKPSERLEELFRSPRNDSNARDGCSTSNWAASSKHLRAAIQNTVENAVGTSCSFRLNSNLQALGELAPCLLCKVSTLVCVYM